tara:strand:- start:14036 stop:14566 length:531 start_codon:yes stop_codon:yes gene_type:complete
MKNANDFQLRGTDLISRKVKTARDESVGSIKDIVLNTSTSQVDYLVLKVDDGFLNLGSKLLALPFESFGFKPSYDDAIFVRETKETLENAPGFDSDNWPIGPQGEFLHTIRTYYSQEDRSLNGRYDFENRTFFRHQDTLDVSADRIKDKNSGSGFLEKDRRGDRPSQANRGGDPII